MSFFSPSYPGTIDSDMNQMGRAEYPPTLAHLQEANTVSSQESSKDFDRARRRATESQMVHSGDLLHLVVLQSSAVIFPAF